VIGADVELVGENHAAGGVDVAHTEVDRIRQLEIETVVDEVGDAHAMAGAVAEVIADDLAVVADDDADVTDAELVAQQLDVRLQERHAVHLQHRFRNPLRVGIRANSAPRRRDEPDQLRHRRRLRLGLMPPASAADG